jgi:hypothetical protein
MITEQELEDWIDQRETQMSINNHVGYVRTEDVRLLISKINDVAEILSAEVERLRAREESLENVLSECLVILEFEGFGHYSVVAAGKDLLDPAQDAE